MYAFTSNILEFLLVNSFYSSQMPFDNLNHDPRFLAVKLSYTAGPNQPAWLLSIWNDVETMILQLCRMKIGCTLLIRAW